MNFGLAVAWTVLVLAGLIGRRPHPARSLAAAPVRGPQAPARSRTVATASAAAVAGAVCLLVWPPLLVALAIGGWGWRTSVRRASGRRRLAAIEAAIPDVVDLLTVAVGAGLNVRLSVLAVASRAPAGPARAALRAATREVAVGGRLSDALEGLGRALGEPARPLVHALLDAERYGAALGSTLDRLAGESRRTRQRTAEMAARQIPVKLLFPLVTCILPAFGLLTVTPLIAGGLRALRL